MVALDEVTDLPKPNARVIRASAPAATKTNARIIRATAVRAKLNEGKPRENQSARRQEWQDEAWDYFDDVPEIKNSTWFRGNAMSKLRIFAAVRIEGEEQPVPAIDPDSGIPPDVARRANAELERLKSEDYGGLSEIMRALEMNLEVAGECHLVGWGPRIVEETDPADATRKTLVLYPESWEVRSTREVKEKNPRQYQVISEPGAKPRDVDPTIDEVIRIYQRHPAWSNLADSNMRGVLNDCEALVLLSNQIKAEAKSQQSAGIFTLPSELSFGPDNETEGEEGEEGTNDPFEDAMVDALVAPVEDPSSPASVAPLLLRGPAEYLKEDYLRHIKFGRESAVDTEARINGRVERIARGVSLPVEVVTGHQQTTFANAAQIDEDTFEDYLEPRCVFVCDALTRAYFQPNLIAAGIDEAMARDLIVWFDAADIINVTDPETSADKGLDSGVISAEAWRREKGWSEDDAPGPEELLFRAVFRAASFDPAMVNALIAQIDPTLQIPADATADTTMQLVAQLILTDRQQASTRDTSRGGFLSRRRKLKAGKTIDLSEPSDALRATRKKLSSRDAGFKLMQIDRDLRARLIVASDRAMSRALERAGNRLKAKAGDARAVLKSVAPMYAAATLGPTLLASQGFLEGDLIGDDAWTALESQFRQWGAGAQRDALNIANRLIGISPARRDALGLRQAQNLDDAWAWTRDALDALASKRLYAPDEFAALGELDFSSRIPPGLVRQAMSIAGGDSSIEIIGDNPYVALSNNEPLGGIATGELVVQDALGADTLVEAWEWVYGPAFRSRPFESHESLDGVTFERFDSDALATDASSDWIGSHFYPGDHDGCNCDIAPVLSLREDLEA